ncbi:unnamed protein product [Malus baccata var. baccata]
MAPKRGRGKSMEELIPPSPMRAKKGRPQARPSQQRGQIHIDFDSKWKPIKENATRFSGQLGIIARNGQKVPLTYVSWTEMHDHVLDDIWKEVTTDEQRLSFTPPQVTTNQWKTLVKYWGLPNVKEYSEANKANHAHGSAPHWIGRTSFAQLKHENQFNQCLEEREEHEQNEDYREEVFTRVMGHDAHGRVRMYGTGITPSHVFSQSSRSSNVNKDTIREEVERQYKTKIDDLKAKHEYEIEDLRSKYSEVSSKCHLVMTHIGFHVNTSPSRSGQALNTSSHLQETYESNEQQPQLDPEA